MSTGPGRDTLATGTMNRRRFLQLGAGALIVGANLTPKLAWAGRGKPELVEKKLSLFNYHTGEKINTVYWEKGEYIPEALKEINHVLRDRRTNEVIDMDPKLLDLLYAIAQKIDARQPIHVVSAYRSPKTNARLRKRRKGVAKNSQHIYGKATDFYLPGRRLSHIRKAAISLRSGGVGYYPRSRFIHVDTGPVRSWGKG